MAKNKTERLLSLIALLLKRGRPVSKSEIRQGIPDYRRATAATFDRTFERDKRELREMGISLRVRTVADGREVADAREAARHSADEIGYSIDRDEYYLPEIDFTPEEWAALSLISSGLKGKGGRGEGEAARSLAAKLSCMKPAGKEDSGAPLAVARKEGREARRERLALAAVQAAMGRGRRVEIDYYSIESDRSTRRTVDPYLLTMASGSWYLVGRCHLRQDVRTFKLSRAGSARATGPDDAFTVPRDFDRGSYLERKAWEFPVQEPVEAVLEVGPEEAWIVRHQLGPKAVWSPDGRMARIKVSNRRPFVMWACANCDRARITGPGDLAREVEGVLSSLDGEYAHG